MPIWERKLCPNPHFSRGACDRIAFGSRRRRISGAITCDHDAHGRPLACAVNHPFCVATPYGPGILVDVSDEYRVIDRDPVPRDPAPPARSPQCRARSIDRGKSGDQVGHLCGRWMAIEPDRTWHSVRVDRSRARLCNSRIHEAITLGIVGHETNISLAWPPNT